MLSAEAFAGHLRSGANTICRCWIVRRADGVVLGFTDHDQDIGIEGVTCRAETGLTTEALSQSTGLAVDNSEAAGALSDASVTEIDLLAGRYDGAEVEAWLVDWSDPEARTLRFRGTIGEIESGGGAFRAELRGLADGLNRPKGRVYQSLCSARLGDAACRVDLSDDDVSHVTRVASAPARHLVRLDGLRRFEDGWFARGRLTVLSGSAAGLSAMIKSDIARTEGRDLTLWQELRDDLAEGDEIRLVAGCDKRMTTCRRKFDNLMNFRGFPHIPGEDWLMAYPHGGRRNDGGSMNR